MSRTFKNRKFKLTFYAKNQPAQLLLTFLTTITRWSYSTSNYYVLIGQNLTGEFMHKIYAASGNVCTDSWNWQSLVSPCDVFFRWVFKMKYSCYQDSSVIYGWFVYWVSGWEMRRLSKSSEIRFQVASFSFSPCLVHEGFMKSSVVHVAILCRFLRFETVTWPSIRFDVSLQNLKKPLDIFWPQIERKCSEEYLAVILAVKRKLWAIFLPLGHLEK